MKNSGFTLIELMITVAIIAIIAAIAIPAYNGYIKEARYSTARANIDSLKLFLEDYRLDNDSYAASGATYTGVTSINASYGWNPRDDGDTFDYSLTSVTADTYTANVIFSGTTIVSCTQTSNDFSCTYN